MTPEERTQIIDETVAEFENDPDDVIVQHLEKVQLIVFETIVNPQI